MTYIARHPYKKPYSCPSLASAQETRFRRKGSFSDGYKQAIMQTVVNQTVVSWVEEHATQPFTYDFDINDIIFTFESEDDYNTFIAEWS